MKTPTVDDSKPKRDKLGPTGPANIADEEPKKGEETKPKETATSLTSRIFSTANVRVRRQASSSAARTRYRSLVLT